MYEENLKRLRLELKLSAQKMADSMNVSRGSIVQYEAGRRKPSYEFMESLHNIYDVNLNWFVSGQGNMFLKQPQTDLKNLNEEQLKGYFKKFMKEEGLI